MREGSPLDGEARLRNVSLFPRTRDPDAARTIVQRNLLAQSESRPADDVGADGSRPARARGQLQTARDGHSQRRADDLHDVNKLLTHADPKLAMRYAKLHELFKTMEELARILIKMRERRGAIDFNLPESVFEFDDEGRVAGVLRADRNIAHRIIEEFMLLANETVASHFQRLRVPSLYRSHEEPQPQRVIEFAELAAAYGYKFPVEGVSSKDYQRLSHQLSGKPEERVLSYAMLRSLQRARYSAQNMGHFGLAAPVYTHFTSPIRRYPDLIVHRVLRALLKISPEPGRLRAAATGTSRPARTKEANPPKNSRAAPLPRFRSANWS